MAHKSSFLKGWVFLGVLWIQAGGCVWGSVQYDPILDEKVIEEIEPGKTTRRDILRKLGPPAVLAEPQGVVWFPSLKTEKEKMRKIDSRLFFKYFVPHHSISNYHVVYYYWNEAEDISGFSLPIPVGTTFVGLPATYGDLQFSELWVLVNRQTDQVEGYVFLKGKEKE